MSGDVRLSRLVYPLPGTDLLLTFVEDPSSPRGSNTLGILSAIIGHNPMFITVQQIPFNILVFEHMRIYEKK